jgi:peptidyl-prolyl cis-trans isomerase SurA
MDNFLLKFICVLVLNFLFFVDFGQSSQFSPAIKVNNVFISKYEVNERKKLLIALGASKSNAKKIAQQNLIDETLQKLHAKTIGVKVLPNQVEEVLNNFIAVRSLTKKSLKINLNKFNASFNELKDYLEANVLMRNVINNTFYSRMNLDDFDFSLFRPSASISIPTQLNISEIIIPFAIRGKENTIKLGERIIKDLNNGKNFEKMAKRFSNAVTSKNGGIIGFVPIETLPDGLKKILIKLKSGENSNLIISSDSIMIFKVNSWKTTNKVQNPPSEITYAKISTKHKKIDNCNAIKKQNIKGPIRSNKLNKKIRDALNQLRPSEKIFFIDKDGAESYLILCSRRYILTENAVKILQGQMLENQLLKLAEGLNLELRRTAEIQYMK